MNAPNINIILPERFITYPRSKIQTFIKGYKPLLLVTSYYLTNLVKLLKFTPLVLSLYIRKGSFTRQVCLLSLLTY